MFSPPLPPNDHPRMKRRTSTPHVTQVKECDILLSKPRPRSGSWAGSTSESHQITVEYPPPRSPKNHFLSHFTKQPLPHYFPSPSRDDVGFVYNPSERSADTMKRKKGPLSGIGNFFRRLRQNTTDPVHAKEVLASKPLSSHPTPKQILPETEEKRVPGIRRTTQHSDPLDPLEPRERSKRESLQAHLRYFGLELNSLLPPSEAPTLPLRSSLSSNDLKEYRQKHPDGARLSMLCSSPSKTCSCIREEPEMEAAGHSSVSLSRGSCYTCESMYNTYTTYRQSENSVTELPTQDCEQGRQHGAAQPTSHFDKHHSDEDEDEVFLDAQTTNEPPAERRADQLTKRLSGGHFGSAGGLILSVSDFLARPLDPTAKRHSTCTLSTTKKDETVTSYGGERRCSQASAHTVVGVLLPPSSEPELEHGTIDTAPSTEVNTPRQDQEYTSVQSMSIEMENSIGMLNETSDKQFVSTEESEEDIKVAARRIWIEDTSFHEDMERVAEWLGTSKPFNQRTLKLYMEYFDFRDLRLDVAFRKLCRKLPLNAESQQIDRILENFAIRYWECNPKSSFGNADVVYAIVYSLLLLNTDLHIAQGDHKKMSRSAFIRNTMCAIRAQVDMFVDLTLISASSIKRSPSARSFRSSKSGRSEYSNTSNPTTSSQTIGSKQWYSEIESMLKDMYVAVKNTQISQPSTSTSAETSPNGSTLDGTSTLGRLSLNPVNVNPLRRGLTRNSIRERSGTPDVHQNGRQSLHHQLSVRSSSNRSRCTSIVSVQSGTSHGSGSAKESISATAYQSIANLITNTQLSASYTCDAPFYKEGVIVGKHLLERADQKAKHREWKEYFCVIFRAELLIHRLEHRSGDRKSIHKTAHSNSSFLTDYDDSQPSPFAVGGGDLMSQAQQVACLDLKHSLSTALPSGYSRQRPHAFALQQAHGGVYVFQVGSDEQLVAWISTLNYWAARESKEPLTGGMDQFKALQKHVQQLNAELDFHREVKPKISVRFPPRTTNNIRALTNWESKAQYLLHEIIKYQNYCDAIEKSLTLQVQVNA
ncbi:hypothetical protein K450DRAFT_255046 [Umbelopsis ramanniana AG]|uniref:Uncharacterized protein n=1 Tax=Umbelopsis ramanniana AG TaxID=1314678 RepID=A0AAD5E437_UMBRA|nr:uncharacterized protein K450DRAFT_255046 [Umbelopsis ramanniana AG]KAI8576803.1 hypothetical protein K450DRAFT_255046 [Umbelopsis ramanniana AG]